VRLFRRLSLIALAAFFLPASGWSGSKEFGVLVLAHGGTAQWNKTVKETVKKAELGCPTRIFFGMANTHAEVDQLQEDVEYLENKGVRSIIIIPLLVSSYSEVYRQWQYLFGLGIQPGFNTTFFPLEKHVDIQFTEPFNDDPIISLVLLDRAREISQHPENETVLLVAHGPNDDPDNVKWLVMMRHLGDFIKERGNFKAAEGYTLRDDAPTETRGQAVDMLRARVAQINQQGGRVLVIPMLIAPGGIENKIGIALKGLDYTLNAKLMMPDDRICQWIRSKVP
jgi:sirohydrochlorin cobaltochelatase